MDNRTASSERCLFTIRQLSPSSIRTIDTHGMYKPISIRPLDAATRVDCHYSSVREVGVRSKEEAHGTSTSFKLAWRLRLVIGGTVGLLVHTWLRAAEVTSGKTM